MVKSDSNIDILFRDGLKDTEVLPPESVWENIAPLVKKKNNAALFFRIAAGIAVLISLGMLAYYYVTGSPYSQGEGDIASSFNAGSPLFNPSYMNVSPDDEDGGEVNEKAAAVLTKATVPAGDNDDIEKIDGRRFTAPDFEQSANLPGNDIRNYDPAPDEIKVKSEPLIMFSTGLVDIEPAGETKTNDRWKVGAMVSPTYLSSNIKTANQALSQINDNENAVLSYSGGFSVSYRMSGRLSVQTGLYYSSLGRDVQGVNSYTGFEPYASSKGGTVFGVRTSSGTVNSTNNNVYLSDITGNRVDGVYSQDNFDPVKSGLSSFGNSVRQNFEFLEVPLILKYKLVDGTMNFNILGGMSYNFLVVNRAWAISDEGFKMALGATEGVENLLLSSSLGVSMEYNISKNLSLNLEPQLRYFLNTGGDLGSGNPYTFGVFSGMHFRF